MKEAVVVSAVRSPIGRAVKGSLRDTRPDELLAIVIRAALDRVPALAPAQVGDVIVGCAFPEGETGMNVARNAAMLAGLPAEVPGMTINRFCSSGLQAISLGAEKIMLGWEDAVVAGGVESMSMIPMGGVKPSVSPKIAADHPALMISMGNTAENVARRFGVTREEQDQFALYSHQKALRAQAEARFEDEIVPIDTTVVEAGEGGRPAVRPLRFDADECPRADTSLARLAALKPAFDPTGTVTAGNSSPLNDGAAAVVLLSREKAAALGLKPLGVFRHFAVAGVPPEVMGIGPVPAVRKLLERAGLTVNDIDLVEINEAFASQAAYCVRELGLDPARVNVNGGAIALGHPLGCTGARLTATLLCEMGRRKARYGIVTMCVGGGMGAAGLYERAVPCVL